MLSSMKITQRGFIVPLLILIIAVLLIGSGAYVYTQSATETKSSEVATTTVQSKAVTPSVVQKSELKTYTSTQYGFSFSYPSDEKVLLIGSTTGFANNTGQTVISIRVGAYNDNDNSCVDGVDSRCSNIATAGGNIVVQYQLSGNVIAQAYSNHKGPVELSLSCDAITIGMTGQNDYCQISNERVIAFKETLKTFKLSQDTNVGIVVSSPKPNEIVKLPITVRGTINGNGWGANEGEVGWVEVFDANGKSISNTEILMATTDWLKLPTSFEAIVGDRQMMSYITTDTGYLKLTSKTEKDNEVSKTFTVPIRFK